MNRSAQSIPRTSEPGSSRWRSNGIAACDVTVVVPTRNEQAGITTFLTSIPDGIAVVAVDSSEDATPEIIASVRPTATVLRAALNIPEARQLGAMSATTPWVLFTDADVVFDSRYFGELALVPVSAQTGGIVGTKGTTSGFDTYHRWFRRGQAAFAAIGVPAATGSNMLVRRSALIDVGGFDPALSVNEDTELMFRINHAGWSTPFATDLIVRSFDHRRLERGVARKLLHGAVRNTILYFGWFDRAVRSSDWGYWERTKPRPGLARRS